LLSVFQGILTTLSQSHGKYKYDYATVPFLAEVFKLMVSGFFLWKECQASSSAPRMNRLEECPFISHSFYHLSCSQQCPVCYLDLCGSINISDNG
ncbi:Nucleotide-sugar transporter, partial [Musa troglodytarum]